MKKSTIVIVCVVLFLIPFGFETGRHWIGWQMTIKIEPDCEYNLKALWIVARHCSVKYHLQFPPPLKTVKTFVDSGESILLTSRTSAYLGYTSHEGTHIDFRGTLICTRDPNYLLKIAKMSQFLSYEPSYIWFPDNRTLAHCPYCRLAVLLDGKLEKR